ncbi:hypothetical protein QFC22_003788 [Naganishia vaughanmartiniae]|uniref:Uncharacterized protein n=1 Tax=Naganishia vaughanmartiniae TaxID=1424756 RepID=A0ACC2X3H4_9TREE|nr:hypothetical protein QFC22_003788 [Naganishia vaughanmartiniae]
MSVLNALAFRTLSSALPVYMAVGKASSSFAVRQLHSVPSPFRPHTSGFETTGPFRHPAQRYPRHRQLSTQTATSPTIPDEVPVVLPTGSNAKGKAKAVDGLHGEIIGHDIAASSPSASTKVAPPRRRSLGLKSKKAAISLTPVAVEHLRELMADPSNPKLIRISVKNKGCAGMSYHLEYVSPPGGKFDEIVEQDGVRVLIDSKALFSIIGSEMDWKEDRLSAKFVFQNPNVKDACGCGESLPFRRL